MRDTYLRTLTDNDEKNILYKMMVDDDEESGHRAKIIMLKDDEYTVYEIRRATNYHDRSIRKWIHSRFNENGIDGIVSKIHKHKPIVKITHYIEKKIIEVVTSNPRSDYVLAFSTWSLRVLAGYVSKEINIVDTKPYRDKKYPSISF